jgi:hypothetical protein
MDVIIEARRYPTKFKEVFAAHQTDLGHQPEMMSAIDEEWYSILVFDGHRALAHAIAPKPIGETGLYDVEPFMGYGGLLVNTNDQCFLREALAAYSGACRSLKVVAELIRFDPLLLNHQFFIDRTELDVIPAKPVIVVSCERDYDRQIWNFSPPCRRRLRRGLQDFSARTLDKSKEIDLFRDLYERALGRVGANRNWGFSDRFYSAIAASPMFEVESVWSNDLLVAAAVIGHHVTAGHYVLAANSEDYLPGAGERLIYEITRNTVARGQRQLMLGGGNTPTSDDPLLRYKARYARDSVTFFVGMMIHDEAKFEMLQVQAIASQPELQNQKYFLKYRLVSNPVNEVVSRRNSLFPAGEQLDASLT